MTMIKTKNNESVFCEKQSFRQWWLWTILFLLNAMCLFTAIWQLSGRKPIGDNPISNGGILFVTGIVLVLTSFIYSIHLETRIGQDGISVRFYPFHLTFKHYPWERISKAYVRRYSALWEYGGWGLRTDFFGRGEAFNVSGNYGLQLEFTSGRKLLIGTQLPDKMEEALKKIEDLKRTPQQI